MIAHPQIAEAFSQSDPILWVQLPDIHQTKVIFVKDRFPDEFTFPPMAMAPSLNMSVPSASTTNPLGKHAPVLFVRNGLI
jgi:hypothetical protein